MEIKDILRAVCAAPSVSGTEDAAAGVIREILADTADCFETDPLGNLKAVVNPDAEKGVILLAHMDKIGFIITGVDKETGFLRIDRCGGSDARTAPASRVTVFGKKALPGVIISTPPHLASPDAAKKAQPIDKLAIDCGLPYEEIKELVREGDRAFVSQPLYEMGEHTVCSPFIDNTAGVAAVIKTAEKVKAACKDYRVECVFTSREEVGGMGAQTAAFSSAAQKAIAIDVSFAKGPGIPEGVGSEMGSGVMIGIAPILQKSVSDALLKAARENDIPYTIEVMGRSTGTDADETVTAREGKLTGLLSMPIRNMHTPVEIADVRDIAAAADLMAAYILADR